MKAKRFYLTVESKRIAWSVTDRETKKCQHFGHRRKDAQTICDDLNKRGEKSSYFIKNLEI